MKIIFHIKNMKDYSHKKVPTLPDYETALLNDNALKIIEKEYKKNHKIISHKNFNLLKMACWLGKYDIIDFLISKGAYEAIKNPVFKKELEHLQGYNREVYQYVEKQIQSYKTFHYLQSILLQKEEKEKIQKI